MIMNMNTISLLVKFLYEITPDYVHSIRYGNKVTNGTETSQKCLIFSVFKKRPENSISISELIPKKFIFDGIEYITDIEEVPVLPETLAARSCGDAEIDNLPHTKKQRPLKSGVSISANRRYSCTLGNFFVDKHDGSLVGISVAHGLVTNPFWNYDKYGLPNDAERRFYYITGSRYLIDGGDITERERARRSKYGLPYFKLTKRGSLLSRKEKNIEDFDIYQPALSYIDDESNNIGYIKRYYPIKGLVFEENNGGHNETIEDLRSIFFDYNTTAYNRGGNTVPYGPLFRFGTNTTLTEQPLVLKELELFESFIKQYGLRYGLAEKWWNYGLPINHTNIQDQDPHSVNWEAITQYYFYDPPNAPEHMSRYWGGSKLLATNVFNFNGLHYTNYIDACVIGMDSIDSDYLKQIGDSTETIYPIASTYEIDNILLGSKVFVNGSSKGFRGSDDNSDCSMYCDGVSNAITLYYPNPYLRGTGPEPELSSDYNENIKRNRLQWKIITRNLPTEFQSRYDIAYNIYSTSAKTNSDYNDFNNNVYSTTNPKSLVSLYLKSNFANDPHPNPTIDEYILQSAVEDNNRSATPIRVPFFDIISFRYTKTLTNQEMKDAGIPVPGLSFPATVGPIGITPELNVVGPGDSGGMLIADINGTKKIVGMIIGASNPWRNRGFAMRIDRIMDRLDLAPWDGDVSKVTVSNKDNAEYIVRPGVMDPPILYLDGKKYFQLNTVLNASELTNPSDNSWIQDTKYIEGLRADDNEGITTDYTQPIFAPIQIQRILDSRYVTFPASSGMNSFTVSELNNNQSYKFRVSIDTGYGTSDSVVTDNIIS